MNAGHGTQAVLTIPQSDGQPNDFALWCGREGVCGWINPTGYGNNWDQYWIAELGGAGAPLTANYDFLLRRGLRRDDWDGFVFLTEDSNGDLSEIFRNYASMSSPCRQLLGVHHSPQSLALALHLRRGLVGCGRGLSLRYRRRLAGPDRHRQQLDRLQHGLRVRDRPGGHARRCSPWSRLLRQPLQGASDLRPCTVNRTSSWASSTTRWIRSAYIYPPVHEGYDDGPWVRGP